LPRTAIHSLGLDAIGDIGRPPGGVNLKHGLSRSRNERRREADDIRTSAPRPAQRLPCKGGVACVKTRVTSLPRSLEPRRSRQVGSRVSPGSRWGVHALTPITRARYCRGGGPSWPSALKRCRTPRPTQPPAIAPCTRTKVPTSPPTVPPRIKATPVPTDGSLSQASPADRVRREPDSPGSKRAPLLRHGRDPHWHTERRAHGRPSDLSDQHRAVGPCHVAIFVPYDGTKRVTRDGASRGGMLTARSDNHRRRIMVWPRPSVKDVRALGRQVGGRRHQRRGEADRAEVRTRRAPDPLRRDD